MGLDGWQQSILDDVPFWEMPSKLMMLALGCCWAQWARFFMDKKGILLAIVCMLQSTLLYMLRGGRNGWMAVDSVGCSCHFWNFQIWLDMVD